MVDPFIQFFLDLIPKLLLAEILDFTWSVTVLTLAVFIATQAAKTAARLGMGGRHRMGSSTLAPCYSRSVSPSPPGPIRLCRNALSPLSCRGGSPPSPRNTVWQY